MKHLFAPYELANKLKEKGFKEDCVASYWNKKLELVNSVGLLINKDGISNPITAPLYQQVLDWFREKHKIHIFNESDDTGKWYYQIEDIPFTKSLVDGRNIYAKEFYEAYDEAIEEALKLI